VEILATAIDNIRHDDFIRVPTSRWPYFVVAVAILWATALAFYRNVEPDMFAPVFRACRKSACWCCLSVDQLHHFFFQPDRPGVPGFVYSPLPRSTHWPQRALERNVVAESLRRRGEPHGPWPIVQIAGGDDTSTAISCGR